MQISRRILLAFHLPEALRDLLEGISDYVKHSGKNWQVECVEPRDFYTAFRRRLVHGAITALGPRSRGIIHRLRISPTPIVNVLRNLHPHLPSVLSDNRAIGRVGAQYLMQRGFRQCAFIGVDTPWSRERHSGFSAALREARLPAPLTLTTLRLTDFDYAARVRAVRLLRKWIRGFPPHVGAMAAADFLARTVLSACQEQAVAVPGSVALLGVDNFHAVCELAAVPLSSVAQDFVRIGHEAAALLDQLMEHRGSPLSGPILVPPGRLHVRKSTDVLAFQDPIVVAALEIIHAHAPTAISMKELLARVPLSRKWLDHRFKQLVGRTPSEEIRRCRLLYVRDLLTDTDMPLRQIAARCRFSCVQNLIRCFRSAHGISPQAFRRQSRIQTGETLATHGTKSRPPRARSHA